MLSSAIQVVLAVGACAGLGCAAAATPTPSCEGDTVIARSADAVSLGHCTELGSLLVRGAGALDLSPLSKVKTIRRSLTIGPTTGLGTLAGFASLSSVGGDIRIHSNFGLGGVFLSGLTTVGGDLIVESNSSLSGLSAPALTTVGKNFLVRGNRELESLLVPTLAGVGGDLDVRGSVDLGIIRFGEALSVGGIRHIEGANHAIEDPLNPKHPLAPTPTLPE